MVWLAYSRLEDSIIDIFIKGSYTLREGAALVLEPATCLEQRMYQLITLSRNC
jgi:hypothetical protein